MEHDDIAQKTCSPKSVSIRDTNHWPLLPWGRTSCKRSVLPTGLSVAELGGLSLLILTFSHATDSTALTSEQHQHRPGGTQRVQLPRNLPEASCARLLASIFWAIYCSPEVFQVSLGFRCNGWSVLGTLLQGAGNESLYPVITGCQEGKECEPGWLPQGARGTLAITSKTTTPNTPVHCS